MFSKAERVGPGVPYIMFTYRHITTDHTVDGSEIRQTC